MPPKRRPAQAKPAPPPESEATKVRKEWTKFIDAWYNPQKQKLIDKLERDLVLKQKNVGPAKYTHKMREMELFEKLDAIAQQLAQPARAEWERRLELAHLREDQWDDMSAEEQQAVMSVFVGFFNDADDDFSATIEEDEEPPLRAPKTIPPTPTRQTFELVNPTSFFTDAPTPPNPPKNLPALSMDHLATLGPSRSVEPVSAGVSATLGFQTWASEVGIVAQQPPSSVKPATQTLSARPRAPDAMSRQPSAASTSSSPPLKPTSPPFSPHNPPTKVSPPLNPEISLGKRYIGPVILEEDEQDPLDETLLKSKMADEYQQYKVSLRLQMIYQFHAEAAEVEIKLVQTLLAGEGTKEGRARAVQEHETTMMRLRDQKEEERKRLCAEEREKRLAEMRLHLSQRRREVEPPKPNPSKSAQRPGKAHQKENVPVQAPPPLAAKLELPGPIKASNSTLSQDETSANEALFANAMAAMRTDTSSVLTSAQASLNEALFANAAAAMLSGGIQSGPSARNVVPPPGAMKKTHSGRSQEQDVPQITVNFAETPVAAEPALSPPAVAVKSKKGKKGQPVKPVVITEEPETDAEPPPVPSLWDAASHVARNVRGATSVLGESKGKLAEELVPEPTHAHTVAPTTSNSPTAAAAPSKVNTGTSNGKKTAKKGKRVTITEEPDVDADPIVSPPPPHPITTATATTSTTVTSAKTKTKGGWGAVGKSKAPVEESEVEPAAPPPSLATPASARSKKVGEASKKPQLKVAVSEEIESVPARTSKKSAWEVPGSVAPSASGGAQGAKKTTQAQAPSKPMPVSLRAANAAWAIPDQDGWGSVMPGALASVGEETEEDVHKNDDDDDDDDEGDSTWFKPENMSYWAGLMGAAETETETLAVPRAATTSTPVTPVTMSALASPMTATEQGKHVRWTPNVSGESDDEEMGDADAAFATSVWMQYAISGGDVDLPTLGAPAAEPPAPERAPPSRGRKSSSPMPPSPSPLDRAGLAGQWPKMESWLSPPARGQNSGSTRVF